MAASYFDVDGTLVRTNLLHPTLYFMVNQATPLHAVGRLAVAFAKAPQMVFAEAVDRRTFNEILFSLYAGMSRDRYEELIGECYDTVIKPHVYEGARDLVARCRRVGQKVVLVSGALEELMQLFADDIGADEVIANRLEFHDRKATGKLLRPVVAGPTKARLVADHAKKGGHDLEECFAYSDSYSDVPMLSVVGQPAAVNPDRRLAILARAYDWPVLELV
jgi:HAD superfamily hydrolase (TIGR01490 family)